MKRIHTFLNAFFIGLLILGFNSCKKGHYGDCFKSNGPIVSETRVPGTFTRIITENKIDVEVLQGNEYKVEVIAGKNIIKHILTEIQGDTILKIENTNRCNFVRGYKKNIQVKVTMPYLSWIGNYGVGTIRINAAFKQDSLLFVRNENSGDTYISGQYKTLATSSHGNGNILLSGSAKELFVYMKGTNFTYAEDLIVSDYVLIDSYSIGDAYINLANTKTFNYNLWKSGSIYYSGNPQALVNLSAGESLGKGKLVKLD
ncbi:MAG: DUF2807 domain-containing protein [Sphingobacteriaceae bacterium]|nr:DUF2807 domain-containing protein [Sphingobacteriaceae bacterium]